MYGIQCAEMTRNNGFVCIINALNDLKQSVQFSGIPGSANELYEKTTGALKSSAQILDGLNSRVAERAVLVSTEP